ncbi:MAG: putative O-glycosylation ligase, exosortase A system-associated [Planctomycetota bacterium]
MRDYFVLLVVFSLLPFGFRNPFFGLLLFNWLAYMRPQDLAWGIAKSFKLSKLSGAALLLGWFAFDMGKRPFARWDIRTISMTLVLILTIISTLFAENQDEFVIDGLMEFTKIILVSLVTTGIIDTKQRLRYLNWVVALGLGFYGFKNGLIGSVKGGTIHNGPGGMMKDNNDFALALVMALSMIWYMGLEEKNKLIKYASRIVVFFTCVTIILTHSRGGFLAMGCVFGVIALRSGKLLRAGILASVAALTFVTLAPDSVLDRLGTINDAVEGKEDRSVGGRFRAWAIGIRMIEHNPILGVGHKNFRDHYQRHAYALYPGEEHFNHVAHNSYVQMWSETGTPAFIAFLVMLGSAYFAARQLRSWAKLRPDLEWCRNYAAMVEGVTVAFMTGGFFLNRAHFDLIWHWMAVTTATLYIARKQVQAATATEEGVVPDAGSPAPSSSEDPSRRPGFRPSSGAGQTRPVWARVSRDGFAPAGGSGGQS